MFSLGRVDQANEEVKQFLVGWSWDMAEAQEMGSVPLADAVTPLSWSVCFYKNAFTKHYQTPL